MSEVGVTGADLLDVCGAFLCTAVLQGFLMSVERFCAQLYFRDF